MYPHSEQATEIVCNLLRLADLYMVDYIKEWYEWLSDAWYKDG